ncbi:MAG: PIN domain-containing protein [Bacillota bacterium]|nr:PIN domain-containing protein [Bacillota bacterium]MDW7684770.1 PIN domain-containing protein [Bacillota bacterium]
MSAKVMIDTNILVYAYDRSQEEKQKAAVALLQKLVGLGVGVISTQVLGEFFYTVTRKIPETLTAEEAGERVGRFCRMWPVHEVSEMIVYEAVRGVREHRFSYWDAQLWATARLNQVGLVLSEDFSHDSMVDGVRFLKPLLPGFELDHLFA